MKQIRLRQLDGLRGLFALMVVLIHFPFRDSIWTSNFIVRQSDMFVDFFFVLSGFVISYNYYDKITGVASLVDYLRNRFFRLFPLLFFTVIVFLLFKMLFSLYFPQTLNHVETPSQLFQETLDSLTFMNSTPVFGSTLGMNYPSWSISAEMIAYACFGLTILLFALKRMIIFLMVLISAALFLILRGRYMMEGDWGFVRAILCFNTGVFTYLLFKRYQHIRVNRYLEYILPLLLVYIFYCRWQMTGLAREMFALAILPAFFGTFIFVYALSDGLYVRRLSRGFFQFLGKISYSVYLNHAIVLILVTRLFFDVLKFPKNEWTMLVSLLFSLVAVILYSKFTFENVELKNMYRYSRKKPTLLPEANSSIGTEATES